LTTSRQVRREREKATYISPAIVLSIDVEPLRILGARLVRAILAPGESISILDIPRIRPQKPAHVRRAGLPRGRVKDGELARLALDLHVPEDGAEQTADEVVEGVEVVEPVAPEGLHGRVGHDDAAEGDEAAPDEERVRDGREVLVGRVGGDGLAHGGVEEFIDWLLG